LEHCCKLYFFSLSLSNVVCSLGIQRLEEAGVLLLAHQAMLEEMLECINAEVMRAFGRDT